MATCTGNKCYRRLLHEVRLTVEMCCKRSKHVSGFPKHRNCKGSHGAFRISLFEKRAEKKTQREKGREGRGEVKVKRIRARGRGKGRESGDPGSLFEMRGVAALIDCGALTAGASNSEIARELLEFLAEGKVTVLSAALS